MNDDPEDTLLGTLIDGRYRVLRLLGRGGMGTVYEVEHELLGQRFALKTLHPGFSRNAKTVARFLREARIASTLGTERIVKVTDVGHLDDGAPYLVMELLRGRDLGQLLETERRLPPARAIAIALEVCEALAAAHAGGIVHRDLKPENIFMSEGAGSGHGVTLLDFGISKLLPTAEDASTSSLTRTGAIIGTPDYMAPEQAISAKSVDARADVYALGVVLYRSLSGRLPFEAPHPGAMLAMIVQGQPVSLSEAVPGIDPALEQIVMRATSRDPEARYATISAFADALRKAAPGTGVGAPVGAPRTSRKRKGMAVKLAIVAAILLSGIVGFSAVGLFLFGREPTPAALAEETTAAPVAALPVEAPLPMMPSAPRPTMEAIVEPEPDTGAVGEPAEPVMTQQPRMSRSRMRRAAPRTMVGAPPPPPTPGPGPTVRSSAANRVVTVHNIGAGPVRVDFRCPDGSRTIRAVPTGVVERVLLPALRCDVGCNPPNSSCPSVLSSTDRAFTVR